jgi:hypothetical protein
MGRVRRGAGRLLLVATTVMAVVLPGTAARAATSGSYIHNDNNQIMVEVWFNSGTHNMSKGRNSFTLKDYICGDGYTAYVSWTLYGVHHSRERGCGEESFSIEPNNVARTQFTYALCAKTTSGGWTIYECDVARIDFVD